MQSLCAVALLAGLVLLGAGEWGAHRFASNPPPETPPAPVAELAQTPADTPAESPSPAPEIAQPTPQAGQIPTPTPEPATPPPTPTPAPKAPGRTLNDAQQKQIVDVLQKHAGKNITICSVTSDAEGAEYAEAFKRVFTEAGWHVDMKQAAFGKPPSGLSLAAGSFPSPENAAAAYLAISAAGLHVSQQLDARLTGGQAELIVGTKQ